MENGCFSILPCFMNGKIFTRIYYCFNFLQSGFQINHIMFWIPAETINIFSCNLSSRIDFSNISMIIFVSSSKKISISFINHSITNNLYQFTQFSSFTQFFLYYNSQFFLWKKENYKYQIYNIPAIATNVSELAEKLPIIELLELAIKSIVYPFLDIIL